MKKKQKKIKTNFFKKKLFYYCAARFNNMIRGCVAIKTKDGKPPRNIRISVVDRIDFSAPGRETIIGISIFHHSLRTSETLDDFNDDECSRDASTPTDPQTPLKMSSDSVCSASPALFTMEQALHDHAEKFFNSAAPLYKCEPTLFNERPMSLADHLEEEFQTR